MGWSAKILAGSLILTLSPSNASSEVVARCSFWKTMIEGVNSSFVNIPTRGDLGEVDFSKVDFSVDGWKYCAIWSGHGPPMIMCHREGLSNAEDTARKTVTAFQRCFPDAIFYRPQANNDGDGHQNIRLPSQADVEITFGNGIWTERNGLHVTITARSVP